jgi:predicted DNA-binding protein (UPF0251 family)
MIGCFPDNTYYKPKGIPASELEETVLALDEFEALKLADFEQRYQEQAAKAMHISRQTFGRIVESARFKIAAALIHGYAIRIEGGEIAVRDNTKAICRRCKRFFKRQIDKPSTGPCPHCKRTIDTQIT